MFKQQKKAEDKVGSVKETDTRGMLSPLANVHPPLPSSYQYPSPVASDPYGFFQVMANNLECLCIKCRKCLDHMV